MRSQDLVALLPRGITRKLDAGEFLFRQGDTAGAIFLVETGRLRLVRHLDDGTLVALHTARAGETFAEAALFADAYHCDAVAEVPSKAVAIPKSELLSAMQADVALNMVLMRLLSGHVRDLRSRLELRNIRSAKGRLLAWLRMSAVGTPPTVRLDRSWTEIASELGLSREVVYRTLADLERADAITRSGQRIVLSARPDI
jgi:CRP-like cAMP-binding protein